MSTDNWIDDIKPVHLVQFFESIPRRLPGLGGEGALERRVVIGRELQALNAITLGREPDFRITPDIEDLAGQLASRLELYGSSDWERTRDGESMITLVRRAVGKISVELRADNGSDESSEDDAAEA